MFSLILYFLTLIIDKWELYYDNKHIFIYLSYPKSPTYEGQVINTGSVIYIINYTEHTSSVWIFSRNRRYHWTVEMLDLE